MKNLFKFISMLVCITVIFSACILRDESNQKIRDIEVTSNGVTIYPKGYIIWSESDGNSADYVPVNLPDIASELEGLTYSDDFDIKYSKEPRSDVSYTVYDTDFNKLKENLKDLSGLNNENDYYVCAYVIWGEAGNVVGMEYYFKLEGIKKQYKLPRGCIEETLAAEPEEAEINIKQLEGDEDIDMSGTWNIRSIETTGAKKKNDNKIEEFESGAYIITINPDGTGYEKLDNIKNNFKWRYVVKDTEKVGLKYEFENGERWQLFFAYVINHSSVVLKKVDRNGGDERYGRKFIRTIYLSHDMDGDIEITSNGKTKKPKEIWVWEYMYGLCGDALPVNLPEIAPELECITYSNDFNIKYSEKPRYYATYTVFDTNFEPLQSGIESLNQLKKGEYYVYIQVTWGNSDFSAGDAYYFKLLVE